jgi:hypothetical protein
MPGNPTRSSYILPLCSARHWIYVKYSVYRLAGLYSFSCFFVVVSFLPKSEPGYTMIEAIFQAKRQQILSIADQYGAYLAQSHGVRPVLTAILPFW